MFKKNSTFFTTMIILLIIKGSSQIQKEKLLDYITNIPLILEKSRLSSETETYLKQEAQNQNLQKMPKSLKNTTEHCKTYTPTGNCIECDKGYGIGKAESDFKNKTNICRKCHGTAKHCNQCGFAWVRNILDPEKSKLTEMCVNCIEHYQVYSVYRDIRVGICQPCALGGCLTCEKMTTCKKCKEGFTKKEFKDTGEAYCFPDGSFTTSAILIVGLLFIGIFLALYFVCCKDFLKEIQHPYSIHVEETLEGEISEENSMRG